MYLVPMNSPWIYGLLKQKIINSTVVISAIANKKSSRHLLQTAHMFTQRILGINYRQWKQLTKRAIASYRKKYQHKLPYPIKKYQCLMINVQCINV